MNKLTVFGHAKINLTLDVVGRRPDGYHDLKMIMQSLDLRDTITLRADNSGEIRVSSNLPYLPTGEKNIAYKAAAAFFKSTGLPFTGLALSILKRIPVCAGLAGGSTDAAAVLRGLDRLYKTHMGESALSQIGLGVGADVPFCLKGGTALVSGIGEIIDPIPAMPPCHIVLVKPKRGLSTAAVFGRFDNKTGAAARPDTEGALKAIMGGDLYGLSKRLLNVLEPAAAEMCRDIESIRRDFLKLGALGSSMSGSGPTVFGLFDDEGLAAAAVTHFKKSLSGVFLSHPFSPERGKA